MPAPELSAHQPIAQRGINRNDDDDSPKVIDGNYSRTAFRAEEIKKRNKAAVSRSNKRGAAFASSLSLTHSFCSFCTARVCEGRREGHLYYVKR